MSQGRVLGVHGMLLLLKVNGCSFIHQSWVTLKENGEGKSSSSQNLEGTLSSLCLEEEMARSMDLHSLCEQLYHWAGY